MIDSLLGESPGKESHQQNVTVTGCNNEVIIIGGNKTKPNLILTKSRDNVKHFRQENAENED